MAGSAAFEPGTGVVSAAESSGVSGWGKHMRRFRWGAAALAVGLAPVPVSAQLAIDRLWVDFEPGTETRADVVIRNESPDRYYISVTPTEVIDPGSATEKRVAIADPEKLGLLVTPNRLILEPGSLRSIRLVSLNNDLKADRVYRVKITPQIGTIDGGDAGAGNRGVAIKVLAAYDLLVTVRPKDPKPDLVATRTASALVIRNAGNSNALLFDGLSCPEGVKPTNKDAACTAVGSKRIYAGGEWTLDLKAPTGKLSFKERLSASTDPKEVSF